jgi:hypothetical protein
MYADLRVWIEEFGTEFAQLYCAVEAKQFLPHPALDRTKKEFTICAALTNKQLELTNNSSTQWCDLILDAACDLIKSFCK